MRLVVEWCGCSRPRDVRLQHELAFRDAVLGYCPSVEKLSEWQTRGHREYKRAYRIGYWAGCEGLSDKELSKSKFIVRFTNGRTPH